jgi:hypothetical protein
MRDQNQKSKNEKFLRIGCELVDESSKVGVAHFHGLKLRATLGAAQLELLDNVRNLNNKSENQQLRINQRNKTFSNRCVSFCSRMVA